MDPKKKERYVYEHLLFTRDDRQTVSSALNVVAYLSSSKEDLIEEARDAAGTFFFF